MACTNWTVWNALFCIACNATSSGWTRIPAMSEELEQLLKNLKLRRILEIYEEQLRAAEKQDVSYAEFLTRLLRAQWHYRQEKALEYRIRRANLPERWSLETFILRSIERIKASPNKLRGCILQCELPSFLC